MYEGGTSEFCSNLREKLIVLFFFTWLHHFLNHTATLTDASDPPRSSTKTNSIDWVGFITEWIGVDNNYKEWHQGDQHEKNNRIMEGRGVA